MMSHQPNQFLTTTCLICDQDMVLMHHEVVVDFPDDQQTERHTGTLLEFGKTKNGKTTTAMALTVGIPAAIGALVLFTLWLLKNPDFPIKPKKLLKINVLNMVLQLILEKKIETKGVLRPLEPEVYVPGNSNIFVCSV